VGPVIAMSTGAESSVDVRAQHSVALAHLESCRARVRELNGALVTEKVQLIDQRRELRRLRPDGSEAGPGERNTWAIIAKTEITGSKWVVNDVDPFVRWRARLDYAGAIEQLRRAELDEAEWRAQLVELDRIESQRRKLALLPAVAKAYDRLDKALVAAAKLRAEVVNAINAVGEVAPLDAVVSASFSWPELGLLDHRRQQVTAWTAQATNGHGSA
jgi:hypothetical protein